MLGGNNRQPDEMIPLPLDKCLAKTVSESPGITVENHCRIVGLVAKELINLFPEPLKSDLFPEGTEFIAACHDIGKVSPAFQKMIYSHIPDFSKDVNSLLAQANAEDAGRRKSGFHAAISEVSLDDVGPFIPEIVGIHHGFSPNTGYFKKGCSLHGGMRWQQEREQLINRLRVYFGFPDGFWPTYTTTQAAAVSGLVTAADWIGSGDVFSDISIGQILERSEVEYMVRSAVSNAGFQLPRFIPNLSFSDIFPFEPNGVQTIVLKAASRAGVYILEAPMGIGKTEAALYAAYRLLAENKATGIYFALPTQLTSEKIHDRMEQFLRRILDPANGGQRARLLHGSSWLLETFMGEDADAGGAWFDGPKRGILAPFAAGTIDQALMAVMNVRHGYVRAFGLAGKVVVLDEVHSYDAFTGTILNRLVDELRALRCTVIILSATLTRNQRRNLLGLDENILLSDSYPLVSGIPSDSGAPSLMEVPCPSGSAVAVGIIFEHCLDMAIEDALIHAERGEQVLWIENTVSEAQDSYRRLSAAASELNQVECGLLHSRFLKHDRDAVENIWVSTYGKDGGESRQKRGRILVGTQVLEQSLDIDADYLITRLCPTDMLFQRIGRLWRHEKLTVLRPPEAKRRVCIIAPLYADASEKPKQFGKSGAVYSEYVLLRTLEVWNGRTSVSLPTEIRDLIEATYENRIERGLSARYKKEMEEKKERLQGMARLGLSRGLKTLPESRASTRYSELESITVLLLSDIRKTEKGRELRFLDGQSVFVSNEAIKRSQRRSVSAALTRNCVRVTEHLAPDALCDISWLKDYIYIGSKEDEETPFRIALVNRDSEITGLSGEPANGNYILRYDSILGYQAEKR